MKFANCLKVATLGLSLIAPYAHAVVIYSETPNLTTATRSDADSSAQNYVANDFVPVVSGAITSVEWRGMYYAFGTPQAQDEFTIKFYADNAGNVGGLLGSYNVGDAVNRSGTGQFFIPNVEFYSYQADLNIGLDVLTGSTYWISIFNDTVSDADDNWFWATDPSSPGPGLARQDSSDGTTWVSSSDWPFYFVLSGEDGRVPVPATLALFSLGLVGLGYRRHKQIKAA